jgi:hypothetical protein
MKKVSKYPPNWQEIRKLIKQRDNNICQHCGAQDGAIRTSRLGSIYKSYLSVAHLDHDAENWEVSMDRLVLLCQPCHLKYDSNSNLDKSKAGISTSDKIARKREKRTTEKELRRVIVEQERIIDRIMGQGFVPNGAFVLEPSDSKTSLTRKLMDIGIKKDRQSIIELSLLIVEKINLRGLDKAKY